jgi:hypothetical protein
MYIVEWETDAKGDGLVVLAESMQMCNDDLYFSLLL